MPSDLRPDQETREGRAIRPLLSGRPSSHSRSNVSISSLSINDRDTMTSGDDGVRKRYIYAGICLLLALVSFTVQTETAAYIQHQLKWNKAFCMLWLTHSSWIFLYPSLLLAQRFYSPSTSSTSITSFVASQIKSLRTTAQIVQHRTIHLPPSTPSPWPYFLRVIPFLTGALTIAGGSWYVAVDLTSAADLTAIYNCSAFFAYAFAIPLLGETFRVSKASAVIIAIVGVLIAAYGDTIPSKTPDNNRENQNRTLGNLITGVGSILYGLYEVLYKRLACPLDNDVLTTEKSTTFAMAVGSMIGLCNLLFLWTPIPILHVAGLEVFSFPKGEVLWMLIVSVSANAVFSGSFLILISLTSPVLSSVAALLTIFLVAVVDQLLPADWGKTGLTGAAFLGGGLIIAAFGVLSWASYKEMEAERNGKGGKGDYEIIDEENNDEQEERL